MSTSAAPDSDLAANLRVELKQWEKAFADAHSGRKPSRDDIKNERVIAAKYKDFNRLVRFAKAWRPEVSTPSKLSKAQPNAKRVLAEKSSNVVAATPCRDRKKEREAREHSMPEMEDEPTPAFIRCGLGPTPQKDGQVLGIFDLLTGNGTPSKPTPPERKNAADALAATPTKGRHAAPSASACSKTPQSSGRRFYLDAFAGTPLKRKRDTDDVGTPSTLKRQFATPPFLRRSWKLDSICEGDEDAFLPTKKPLGSRKGLVRSLSTIIAGLRKQEDDHMDEEWEVMKELEAEETGMVSEGMNQDSEGREHRTERVQVEDSQVQEMPLGPDQAPESEEEADDKRVEAPRKPWKKKGLKRQTKKVSMKPVLHAPQKAENIADVEADEYEDTDDNGSRRNNHCAEKDASTGGEACPEGNDRTRVSKRTKKATEGNGTSTSAAKASGDALKKAVKKVGSTAHMNFRRLKIKSKNSKPKGGRFGRR